jgi:hypothetical protein
VSDDRQLGIDASAGAESEQGFYDSSVTKLLDFSHELARQLIRRRMHAVVPQAERLVRTFCQLLGTSSPRKKVLTFVAAGIVGLAVIFVLLEISVRRELAKEAADAMAGGRRGSPLGVSCAYIRWTPWPSKTKLQRST